MSIYGPPDTPREYEEIGDGPSPEYLDGLRRFEARRGWPAVPSEGLTTPDDEENVR